MFGNIFNSLNDNAFSLNKIIINRLIILKNSMISIKRKALKSKTKDEYNKIIEKKYNNVIRELINIVGK